MVVKSGYKLTIVGSIPDDWQADLLGRFWSVTDCKHVTARFVAQGIPVASIREVQSRFVDLTNAKQTTSGFYNLLVEGGRMPRPGDLILSRNATVGEVAQVEVLIAQELVAWLAHGDNLSSAHQRANAAASAHGSSATDGWLVW